MQELSDLIGAEKSLSPFEKLKILLANLNLGEETTIDGLEQSILLIRAQLSLHELILDKAIKASTISNRRSK